MENKTNILRMKGSLLKLKEHLEESVKEYEKQAEEIVQAITYQASVQKADINDPEFVNIEKNNPENVIRAIQERIDEMNEEEKKYAEQVLKEMQEFTGKE